MYCKDDHHTYELANFEHVGLSQELKFIKKEPELSERIGLNPPVPTGKLITIQDGTTNEEVLAMLIHRLNGLQGKFPCRESVIAITHLKTALLFLEKRTKDRQTRGVEGKHIA